MKDKGLNEGIFAEKLLAAQEKTAKENAAKIVKTVEPSPTTGTTESAIPTTIITPIVTVFDVNKIGMVDLSSETLVELRKKAQEERLAVDAVGRKIYETRKKIDQIKADPDLKGTSTGESILTALRKDLTNLKSMADEYFQKRAEGFALVEEIRDINPEHIDRVREIYDRVVKLGYRRVVSKRELDEAQKLRKRLEGLIFFEGKITVSAGIGDEKNSFYRALEAELRKLTDKAKTSKAAIIAAVPTDLTGYGHGKPGMYQMVSPYHKDEEGGREFFEGRASVKLFDANRDRNKRPYIKADVMKATGSLGWAENHPGKRPIPLDWIRHGEIPPDKKEEMTSDQIRYAEKIISNFRRIYGTWHKGLNPEAAKPKDEKPEGPAVNAVADTDMTNVVVETVTSEKTEKPAKTKKAKKS
jgi:hypothetical protein